MPTALRLLLVEDSEDDAILLLQELRRGGFVVDWKRVDTPEDMRAELICSSWDLVISDYSMPLFSGPAAIALLRSTDAELPFIFVSGTIGEDVAVQALRLGANDYLMKDNLKRLVAAVRRELKEAGERLEKKRLEGQVRQLQKFEALSRLAGGIVHDYNNTLGAILGWAEMGIAESAGTKLQELFVKIGEQGRRAAGLTAKLLALSRRQVLQPVNLNLNDVIAETSKFFQRVAPEGIRMSLDLAADLHLVRADVAQMEQVLMNLFLNARDAMPAGGTLAVESRNVEQGPGQARTQLKIGQGSYVRLAISDSGEGMDESTLEHVFEPFYSKREGEQGAGLGLAIVYGIVRQHGGIVSVESQKGHGATFHVYLPVGSDPAKRFEGEGGLSIRESKEPMLRASDTRA